MEELNPRDKAFMIKMKDQGYGFQESYSLLQKVKSRKAIEEAAIEAKKTPIQKLKAQMLEGVDTSNLKTPGGLTTAISKIGGNIAKNAPKEEMGAMDYVKEAVLSPFNAAIGAGKGLSNEMAGQLQWGAETVGAEGLANKISAGREKYLKPKGFVQEQVVNRFRDSADVKYGAAKSVGEMGSGLLELGLRGVGKLGSDKAQKAAEDLSAWSEEEFAPTNAAQKAGKITADIGSYVVPGMAVAKVGKLAKGASTLQKLGGLGKAMAAEGAVSGGVTALKEGELNSKVAMDALIGAGFPLAASAVGKTASYFMKPKATKDLIKEADRIDDLITTARNADIPADDIAYIQKLSPQNKGAAVEVFESAMTGRGTATPFAVAGKYIDDYVKRAEQLLSEQGAIQGAAKEGLRGKIMNPRPVKQGVQNLMKKLGVKFDARGVPDFSLSSIDESGKAKRRLTKILEISKQNKIDAADMENLTSQIDSVTGLLGKAGLKESDPGIKALANAKTQINAAVRDVDQIFGAENEKYARLRDLVDTLKHGSEAKLKKGKVKFSGSMALRRLLGNVPEKQKEALKAIEGLSQEFNLKPDLDFAQLAEIADMAEKASGKFNPQSMAGIVALSPAARRAREVPVVGGMLKAKDWITDVVSAFRGARDATARAEILSQLVDMMPKEAVDAQLAEALQKLPAEKIDQIASMAMGSLLGTQMSPVQESMQEDVVIDEGQ